jgi:hypothetical protein
LIGSSKESHVTVHGNVNNVEIAQWNDINDSAVSITGDASVVKTLQTGENSSDVWIVGTGNAVGLEQHGYNTSTVHIEGANNTVNSRQMGEYSTAAVDVEGTENIVSTSQTGNAGPLGNTTQVTVQGNSNRATVTQQ